MFLHICVPEKFTRPFIEFTAEHFSGQAQKFLFQAAANELRQADPATFAAVTSRSFPFDVFFYEETRSRVLRDLKLLFEPGGFSRVLEGEQAEGARGDERVRAQRPGVAHADLRVAFALAHPLQPHAPAAPLAAEAALPGYR